MTIPLPSVESIDQAAQELGTAIRHTPLLRSMAMEKHLKAAHPIYLKAENLQFTGSFKVRGALCKLLRVLDSARSKGVITASAGNHAQGVAFHAERLGVRAKIVMPVSTPLIKVTSTRGYGAEVVLAGESYQEAYNHALEIQKTEGREYIHAFDDDEVIRGQGTLGREIWEDCPDISNVIVPIGGGGLIAGVGAYLKQKNPKIKIIGVQAEGCSTFLPSLKAGKPVTLDQVSTIAEGMSAKRMGDKTFEMARQVVDETIVVSDEAIAEGVLWCLEREHLFVEGCGGAAIAAAVAYASRSLKGSVAVVLTGGNLDVNLLARIIERGLRRTGRLTQVEMSIPDVPGSLEKLVHVFAEQKASIVQIHHERVFGATNLREVFTSTVLEVSGPEHIDSLKKGLEARGYRARFI